MQILISELTSNSYAFKIIKIKKYRIYAEIKPLKIIHNFGVSYYTREYILTD